MNGEGENGDLTNQFHIEISPERNIAAAKINGIHLNIAPAERGGGFVVHILGDTDGQADFTKILKGTWVNGSADDLPEIADTYARRLASGVKPEDMFTDIEETTVKSFKRILGRMKTEGIKSKRP